MEPPSAASAPRGRRPACALPGQVLLAVYFFLAGCVVSQSRTLWVMPAASAVFACALALTAGASSALSSTYRWARPELHPG